MINTRINRITDIILNITIFSIGIISVLTAVFILNNLTITGQSRNEGLEAQTYTRFNSCAIAQRSYRGSAALNRAEIDYCWGVAEKATGYKVHRYYGKEI